MELRGRLGLIGEMVPSCSVLCDIGTDHAYIPIYAVGANKCARAIATDIKKGPLLAAERNIKGHGLECRIETRLGNGLECIDEGEADVIIIAGMGGILIREILLKGIEKAKKANALIIQPMNAIEIVREWLYENGFDIYDETLTQEGEKIYVVIAAKWAGFPKKVDKIYYHIGEKLIEKNDPILRKYIDKKYRQLEKVIYGLQKSKNKNKKIESKYEWMKEEMHKIKSRLEEF